MTPQGSVVFHINGKDEDIEFMLRCVNSNIGLLSSCLSALDELCKSRAIDDPLLEKLRVAILNASV